MTLWMGVVMQDKVEISFNYEIFRLRMARITVSINRFLANVTQESIKIANAVLPCVNDI